MHPHLHIDWVLDLGCDKKPAEKTGKYSPIAAAFKQYWRRVKFVPIPIRHAGTTLTRNLDHLTAGFSTVHPRMDHASAIKDTTKPNTDSNDKSHDYCMFKSFLGALADLALSRLLGFIRNMKHLVEALRGL
jgi:hypothetical protein